MIANSYARMQVLLACLLPSLVTAFFGCSDAEIQKHRQTETLYKTTSDDKARLEKEKDDCMTKLLAEKDECRKKSEAKANEHQAQLSAKENTCQKQTSALKEEHSKSMKSQGDEALAKEQKCQHDLDGLKKEHSQSMKSQREESLAKEQKCQQDMEGLKKEFKRRMEDAKDQCHRRTRTTFDMQQKVDQYDGILDILNVSNQTSAWPLYLRGDAGRAVWNERHYSSLVCVTGKFNAGKTELISNMYNVSLPAGDDLPTMGISFVKLQQPNNGLLDVVLDTAGKQVAIGSEDQAYLTREVITEDLMTDICTQSADVTILVTREMTQNDQDQMKVLLQDRSHADLVERGAVVVVVHNYRDAHNKEALEGYWDRFVTKIFPDIEKKPSQGGRMEYGDSTLRLDAQGHRGSIRLRHLALANQHSEFGKQNNALMYQTLRDWIVDQKKAGGFYLKDRIISAPERLLPEKYLDMGQEKATISVETPDPAALNAFGFPPLCRGSARCKNVSDSSMELEQILRVKMPEGVIVKNRLAHTQAGYRSHLQPTTFTNKTVSRELRCHGGDGDCVLVLELPGCFPHVDVASIISGHKVIVGCCRRPEYFYGDIQAEAFKQGCFNTSISAPRPGQVLLEPHEYQQGILKLTFVDGDKLSIYRAREVRKLWSQRWPLGEIPMMWLDSFPRLADILFGAHVINDSFATNWVFFKNMSLIITTFFLTKYLVKVVFAKVIQLAIGFGYAVAVTSTPTSLQSQLFVGIAGGAPPSGLRSEGAPIVPNSSQTVRAQRRDLSPRSLNPSGLRSDIGGDFQFVEGSSPWGQEIANAAPSSLGIGPGDSASQVGAPSQPPMETRTEIEDVHINRA